MKSISRYGVLFLFSLLCNSGYAQRVGINTTNPEHSLDIAGSGDQYMRLHQTAFLNPVVELEFLRGLDGNPGRDWKLSKLGNDLVFAYSDDNFNSGHAQVMRILTNGNIGIPTSTPESRLHITGGENATNTEDGYLVLGQESVTNLVLDNNAILSRSNGAPASLYLQQEGGNTYFGFTGATNTIINNGKASIGGYSTQAALNVDHNLWQLQLNNFQDNQNNWFIGASNGSWLAGDDQLLFSPTTTSQDAVFRLMDIADNDGTNAPVMLYTSASQVLLLDGSEIDTKSEPLYFNFNTGNDVYLNPNEGKVSIGGGSPTGKLQVEADAGYTMTLESGTARWQIEANANHNVYFFNHGLLRAHIDWNAGGTWVATSDERLKEDISPLFDAMEKVRKIRVRRYNYIQDVHKTQDIGVIAQEVREVIPEAVFEEEGRLGVNYDQLTVVALRGIQEQQQRLEQIDKKLDALLRKTGK